jgi:hypothetical protein
MEYPPQFCVTAYNFLACQNPMTNNIWRKTLKSIVVCHSFVKYWIAALYLSIKDYKKHHLKDFHILNSFQIIALSSLYDQFRAKTIQNASV